VQIFSISGSHVAVVRILASALQHIRGWLARLRRQAHDLAGCRLVFTEKTFSINQPIMLIARVDRIYHDGIAMVLMELKTRYAERVYPSDIIELSAQRLAVSYCTGAPVNDFGYILQQHPVTRRRIIRKVSLLSHEDVMSIAHRHRLLFDGGLPARQANNPECCRRCEYQSECRSGTPRAYRRTE
jgi:CRISPR-associated exonuclease Cas4